MVSQRSTADASALANAQQQATADTIAAILAQGDALKGELNGRIAGGSQGYYEGGSPGYWVDNSGAVNSQYNGIRDDTNNVYGQAIAAILAQNPAIQAAGSLRDATIRDTTAVMNDQQKQVLRTGDAQQVAAAKALGIDAGVQNNRTATAAAAISGARNYTAGSQRKYFDTLTSTALGRNKATADTFGNERDQQQAAIQAARQRALADAVYYVGGSKGRYHSTYGSAGKKADRSTISAITKAQKKITSGAAAEAKQRANDPSIRQGQVQANRRLF